MKTKILHKYSVKRRVPPLRKRIVLHASSILLVLGAGFIPQSVLYQADASGAYNVSAKVAAPIPAQPAVITSPNDKQHVGNQIDPVVVAGKCPDQSYVKLYRDVVLLGVAQCDAQAFTIQTSLAPAANILSARVFNVTDDEGPVSAPVTVYYDAPVVSAEPGKAPLTINLGYYYESRLEGEPWQWDAQISNGSTPYKVTIAWGDGQTDHIDRPDGAPFVINNTFVKAGNYRPLMRVIDARGEVAIFQLSAVVKAKASSVVGLTVSNPWIMWSAYGGVLSATVVFWVRELFSLYRRFWRMLLHRHV